MKTCATCLWWLADCSCTMITTHRDKAYIDLSMDERDEVYVDVELKTSADFGCTLHEDKLQGDIK